MLLILFQITYTGDVEWRTRDNYLVQIKESGEISTQSTAVTISALSPDTKYHFAVSAITERGPGAESVLTATTQDPVAGKSAVDTEWCT